MLNRSIPADEQIDAVLAGQLGGLLDRHRLSRETLQRKWSVSVNDIVSRARQRGLESFVRDAPAGDGVYLVRHSCGYEVAFIDHGCQLFEERFESLEVAFTYWVEGAARRGRAAARWRAMMIRSSRGWRCRTIFNCTEACPREIRITKAIGEVKKAILKGSARVEPIRHPAMSSA